MKKKVLYVLFTTVLVLTLALVPAVPAVANDVASSTMIFNGALTYEGGGVYTGTISMTQGTYYVSGGPGEDIYTGGGFDLYAEVGGEAYVEGYYGTGDWNGPSGTDTFIIGSDHDAYPDEQGGGPWGSWYNPDCADWSQYELEITEDHWYLRYAPTGESPMSGELAWYGNDTAYAAETDPGTVADDHGGANTDAEEYTSGGAQEWGWHAGWGEERIPLEFPGFDLTVSGTTGDYTVTMVPASAGAAQLTVEVPDIVAISVNPMSIDFGTMIPGNTSSEYDLVVTNVGTHTVDIDADVSGVSGDLFYDNLQLKNYTTTNTWSGRDWPVIVDDLEMDISNTLKTKITVPSGYTPEGVETAQLTFTVTPVP